MEESEGNPPSREGSNNKDTLPLAQTYEDDEFVTAEVAEATFDSKHAQHIPVRVDTDEMQAYPNLNIEIAGPENTELTNQVQNVNTPVLTSGSESGHQVSNTSGHEGNTLGDTSIPVVQPAFRLSGREDQNVEMLSSLESPIQYINSSEEELPHTGQELPVLDQSTLNVLPNSDSSQESQSNEPIPSTSKQARLMQEKGVPPPFDTRTHSREKRFVCEECGKGFSYRSHLTEHTRTHTGAKPYVCETCKKGFTQSSHLTQHRRTHTGTKPYVCKTCKKGFAQSSHLTQHRRTHTGTKPHVCKTCNKAFARRSSLIYHRTTHTGEKRFVCKTCCKGFSQSGALTRHRRTPYTINKGAMGTSLSQMGTSNKMTRKIFYNCALP